MDEPMTEEQAEGILTADPEEPVSRETPAVDPAAPFGRFRNGKARRTPAGSSGKAKRPAAQSAPKTPRPPSRKPARSKHTASPDYQTLCREAIAVPETVLALVAAQRKSERLLADAEAVSQYADALAEFGAEMAATDARFAAVLEGIASRSPWMKGLAIVIPLTLQIAANHDRVKPNPSLGVVSRETLLERARARMEPAE